MIDRAQQVFRRLQTQMSSTLQLAADLGDSVGVPPKVTTLLRKGSRVVQPPPGPASGSSSTYDPFTTPRPQRETTADPAPVQPPAPSTSAQAAGGHAESEADDRPHRARRTTRNVRTGRKTVRQKGVRKRSVTGNNQLPDGVQALQVDDAIAGSTYLARIVWALGVANLEGSGPLRPADIARMIMARSPVSLEPPNVARYIRRSNPQCLAVAHTEGSSNFYRLNAEGKRLFNEHFRID